jgi:hypothetical protein
MDRYSPSDRHIFRDTSSPRATPPSHVRKRGPGTGVVGNLRREAAKTSSAKLGHLAQAKPGGAPEARAAIIAAERPTASSHRALRHRGQVPGRACYDGNNARGKIGDREMRLSCRVNYQFTVHYPFSDSRMLPERSCFSLILCRDRRLRPHGAGEAIIRHTESPISRGLRFATCGPAAAPKG